jgi:hypothetical protein
MLIYTQEDDVKLVQNVASASTLISSLVGEVREYILQRFPKNFFKSIYIDTAETIGEMNKNARNNSNTLNKKSYPQLSISPEISLDDPIGGMEKSPHMSSPNLFLRKDIKNYYKTLAINPGKKYTIHYTGDYITTNFNFKITTNKYIQNVDLAYYLKSRFQNNFFQFLSHKYINTEIPKTFMKIIAFMQGYDMSNLEDLAALERYMISTGTSADIVKKKVNLSTGKTSFFVNEKVNLLTLFTDLDAPSSIAREQMSEGEYTITFRVQVSAWLPNAFIMSVDRDALSNVNREILERALDGSELSEQDEGFFSLSMGMALNLNKKDSIEFIGSDPEEVRIGQRIFDTVFTFDTLSVGANEVDLAPFVKDDFKKVHAYMTTHNLDTRDLYYVTVFDRDGAMEIDVDYELLKVNVDLDKLKDFSLTIYADRAIMATIEEAIKKDNFFFKVNALSIIFINVESEVIAVPVYAFENKAAMEAFSFETALRVMTIYGPGYIGLVPEDDPLGSGYKILVGYTDDFQEIIREIEIAELFN